MDLLVALNTGHRGALSTVHANGAEDALRRIETLAMMAGLGVPHEVVRDQLADAIDLVLHLERARRRAARRRALRGRRGSPALRPSARSGPEARTAMTAAAPVLLAALGGAAVAVAAREWVAALPRAAPWIAAAVGADSPAARTGRRPSGSVAGSASWPAPCSAPVAVLDRLGPLAGLAAAGPPPPAGRWRAAGAATASRSRATSRDRRRHRRLGRVGRVAADRPARGRHRAERPERRRDGAGRRRPRARDARAAGARSAALRVPSERVDALVAAILSQERAGGDLAGLLRRHARAAAQRSAPRRRRARRRRRRG